MERSSPDISRDAGCAAASRNRDAPAAVRFRQVPGWLATEVTDGLALHDQDFKSVHYLNHTAAIVFHLCADGIGLDVLSAVVREEFGLGGDPSAELLEVIGEMVSNGLLEGVPLPFE
jgi:hypothetical protein